MQFPPLTVAQKRTADLAATSDQIKTLLRIHADLNGGSVDSVDLLHCIVMQNLLIEQLVGTLLERGLISPEEFAELELKMARTHARELDQKLLQRIA